VPKAAPKAIRRRRQRGSINAEEIIAGAFEVARRESLDQLSMPALAEHLGVGVTSIYWYFRKKDDLLNAMTDVAIDTIIQRMPPLPDDQPWQDVFYNHWRHSRDVHRNDQILTDLLLIRTSTFTRYATRRAFEIEEAAIRMLVDAGFTPENALMVYNATSIYVRGMIINERILRLSDAPTLDDRQRRIADWSAMPLLEGLVDRHPLAGTTDEDFAFGMARLISGFEALLREQNTKAAGRQSATKRVTAAKRAASSGERAAPQRAAASRSGAAAKPAARSAATSKATAGSQTAGGRTRARRAS
jgi:AcrR family transcriptional regulator